MPDKNLLKQRVMDTDHADFREAVNRWNEHRGVEELKALIETWQAWRIWK